ncbi:MAG: efflux RND transporter periplasmic adaptor subunit [Acidaminococcaceae bacterium]
MLKFLKNNKYLIIIILVLFVAGIGGYKYYQDKQKAAEPVVKTATVEKGNVRKTISATGALSAIDNVSINSKITGRIIGVFVEENQHVEAGQKLVQLDDTTLLATQKQKEALLTDAAAKYNRYLALVNDGAIARSDYDTAKADYLVAQAAYDSAVSSTKDTTIYSPISGTIIGKPTPVGQTVSSGISTPQVLMSVANLNKMQIELMVDESDIGQVVVGQKVEFTVDSYTNRTFEGEVRLVSRSATTTNNVIYYTVYVNVDNADGKLLPTMTARANVIVGEKDGVLMVPTSCLRTEGKQKYVQVYDEKTKEISNVNVNVGLLGDDTVEVTGDLQEGQKVLVKATKATTTNKKNNNILGGPGHGPGM